MDKLALAKRLKKEHANTNQQLGYIADGRMPRGASTAVARQRTIWKYFGVFIISCGNVTHGKITLNKKHTNRSEKRWVIWWKWLAIWIIRIHIGSDKRRARFATAIGCQTDDMNNKQTLKINNNESLRPRLHRWTFVRLLLAAPLEWMGFLNGFLWLSL